MEGPLSRDDKSAIVGLYESRYHEKGRSISTVGWSSVAAQHLRFAMLFRGLDPRGKSILDVGCGLGDLVPWLDATIGQDYDYVGVDICASLIEDAKRTFGGPRRRFSVCDILQEDVEPADIVVLSGALNFRVADNLRLSHAMLERMFTLATYAGAANFLTTYVDYEHPRNYHHSPSDMLVFARTLTPYVSIHHDYPLYEFTLQMLRAPREAVP